MKRILMFCILLIMSDLSYSQQTVSPFSMTREDYLKKGRNQNTAGWFLTGGGIVLITIAASIETKQLAEDLSNIFSFSGVEQKSSTTADVLGYTGLACVLGSIPLFTAAHKNKKKAINLSFKNEMVPQIFKQSFVSRSVPSLILKISL